MVAPLYKKLASPMGDNETELHYTEEYDDEDDDEQNWEDWTADGEEGEDDDLELVCLFCDSKYASSNSLFEHCCASHNFDFESIRTTMKLDFYGCFKLINYIRSQVAKNQCWSCGSTLQSRQELQGHLHEPSGFSSCNLPWDNDMYLKPYMEEDQLLFSFGEDEEVDDDCIISADEDLVRNIDGLGKICIDDGTYFETFASNNANNGASPSDGTKANANDAKTGGAYDGVLDDKKLNSSFADAINREIVIVNKNYFGSYGSFGIHREMISDKVRTDAYRQAIVDNPSLIKGAVVLDVGCGTGILSLFAAQAGASIVNAVEASDKMASVASQIAKDNGLFWNQASNGSDKQGCGVVKVINGMVEDLIKSGEIEPQSVDVLLSEWMGYCLLYESMLSSVLVARDHWLKPGGAILPDTATMFVAGFGKGATSIPFWENVYGFNMSCIGNEVVEDAGRVPIVDVVDGKDLVTNTALLQVFDLVTMKHEDVDFTATVKLEQMLSDSESTITKCYGIVLWFETSFTSRFCKETPTVLTTSPYTPPTHWSQTILTFHEPISLASKMLVNKSSSTVGSDDAPAVEIDSRISIARGAEHRSIDISLEVTAIGFDSRKCKWPVQIFNMR